jgi:hypothetical protein
MAGKLNPMQVSKLSAPGRYQDGGGLMLDVRPSGSKTWIVRLQSGGKRRDYGLGSLKDVGLSEARENAREYRRMLRSGVDPLQAKSAARPAIPTFREAATQVTQSTRPAGGTASTARSGFRLCRPMSSLNSATSRSIRLTQVTSATP